VRDYFVAMDARILEVHQMTDDQLEALLKEAAESCNQGLQFCETIVAAYDAFWRARTSAPSKRPTPRPTPKPTNKPEIVTVAKTDRPATNNPTIRITTSAPTRTHFALTISDVFTDTSVVNSAYEVPKFKIGIEAMARLSLGGDFVGLFDSKNTRSDIKFDANDPLSSLAAIPARFTFVVSAEITWSGQPGCTDPDIDPPNHLLLCKRTVSKNLYNNDAVDPFITCECANKAESNQVFTESDQIFNMNAGCAPTFIFHTTNEDKIQCGPAPFVIDINGGIVGTASGHVTKPALGYFTAFPPSGYNMNLWTEFAPGMQQSDSGVPVATHYTVRCIGNGDACEDEVHIIIDSTQSGGHEFDRILIGRTLRPPEDGDWKQGDVIVEVLCCHGTNMNENAPCTC